MITEATYPGVSGTFIPSSAYFRVSAIGDVYFMNNLRVTHCSKTAPPIGFRAIQVYGVAASRHRGASATPSLLVDDEVVPTTNSLDIVPTTFAVDRGANLYVASKHLGTIVRIGR